MVKKVSILKIFNTLFFQHFVFWCLVFIYYTSTALKRGEDVFSVIKFTSFELLLQITIAYTIIYILIPKLLNKNKKGFFFFYVFLMIVMAHVIFSIYLNFYTIQGIDFDAYTGFIERITYKYGYVTTFVSYFFPTALLLVFNYFKQQQEVASLLEQKKTNELNALKNQLNPHFLFNTLNNLYTLSLKKSDKTPQVIAKLSDILDYILYRCKNDFVPIKNEVELLHNYIALEKVRYGKRVNITFNENVDDNVEIAPLILLTFLENTFKHGVSQEINMAIISIDIIGNSKFIEFKIYNSKPNISEKDSTSERDSIGLNNIKKQLSLLYPNRYQLDIVNEKNYYRVYLKIILNDL